MRFATSRCPSGWWRAVSALAFLTLSAASASAGPLFGSVYQTFATGAYPACVVLHDMDGDGIADVLTADYSGSTVSVLPGHADGSFGAARKVSLVAGSGPHSIATGDFNEDGIADFAVAEVYLNGLTVFLGTGGGAFGPGQVYGTGILCAYVLADDVDGDGHADLLAANSGSGTVTLLHGDGAGGFQRGWDVTAGTQPECVALADMDLDGVRDLLVSNGSAATVSVLHGLGNGTFGTRTDFASGYPAEQFAVGDLNGDGVPDVALATFKGSIDADHLVVFLGDGVGGFAPRAEYLAQVGSWATAIVDADGDTHLDIVLANSNTRSNSVSIFRGVGDGTFGTATSYPAGPGPNGVVAGDVTGDGHADLLVSDGLSTTVALLRGNGDGTFGQTHTYAAGESPWTLVMADLSGDGQPELVVTDYTRAQVGVFPGLAGGGFGPRVDYAVGSYPTGVAVGDLNGDGTPDLVVANSFSSASSSVSVLLATGGGSFQPRVDVPAGSQAKAVVVADLNGDGHLDIATANYGGGNASVLLGHGDGTFAPHVEYAAGTSPDGIAAADLDGDGDLDLAVANYQSVNVTVLRNGGAGTFSTLSTLSAAGFATGVVATDLSGDGLPDIAVAEQGSYYISVYLSTGEGTFQPRQDVRAVGQPASIAVADVDGDGAVDLVAAAPDLNTVEVHRGNGVGGFFAGETFGTGTYPWSVALADLTGDGRPEVATADYTASTATVLTNTSAASVSRAGAPAATPPAAGEYPASVLAVWAPAARLAGANAGQTRASLTSSRPPADRAPATTTFAPEFSTPFISYPLDGTPSDAVTADVNGDGRPDVVTCLTGGVLADNVELRLGLPGGIFGGTLAAPTGALPVALAATELDGDGRADIVVANKNANSVSILHGHADGTLGDRVDYAVPAQPVAVAVHDLDGDGLVDIAVASTAGQCVSVLRGLGGGAFAAPVVYFVASNPQDVAIGDVDGDGHSDLVVSTSYLSAFSVCFGAGDGTFWRRVDRVSSAGAPYHFVLHDYTADGVLDITAIVGSTGLLALFAGTGTGDFTLAQQVTTGGTSDILLTTADLDGDGVAELVLGPDGLVSCYRAVSGLLQPFGVALPSGGGKPALCAADFDGDGRQDIAAANPYGYSFGVYHSAPDGTLGTPLALAGPGTQQMLVTGDINGDSWPDIVTCGWSDSITVWLGSAAGTYTFGPALPRYTGTDVLALADLNRDGILDLVVSQEGDSYLHNWAVNVLLGHGDGSFTQFSTYYVLGASYTINFGDLNEDGFLDMLVMTGRLTIFYGSGDGRFPRSKDVQTFMTGASDPVVADVTGDGHLDLVVHGTHSFSVYAGKGNGGLLAPVTYTAATSPVGLAVTQMPGDAYPDVVLVTASDTVQVFPGQAGGSFGAPITSAATASCTGALFGDVDGDGVFDIVTVNQWSNGIGTLHGTSDSHFERPVWYGTSGTPFPGALVDVNHDGAADVILGSETDLGPAVVRNTHTGSVTGAEPPSSSTPRMADLRIASSGGTPRFLLSVPRASQVTLDIWSVDGRRVTRLIDGWYPAGRHAIEGAPLRSGPRRLAAGLYWARLSSSGTACTRRFVLVR